MMVFSMDTQSWRRKMNNVPKASVVRILTALHLSMFTGFFGDHKECVEELGVDCQALDNEPIAHPFQLLGAYQSDIAFSRISLSVFGECKQCTPMGLAHVCIWEDWVGIEPRSLSASSYEKKTRCSIGAIRHTGGKPHTWSAFLI